MWNGVMTMTDEEWGNVEKSLSRPYGHAKFMIDGYTVDVAVQPEKKLKYVLTVYVNKKCALYTCVNDCDIRSRFYYPSKRSSLSAADKQKLKKVSKARRESITQMAAYTAYSPFWGSFSRMKAHFIRNNQSIRLIKC